MDEPKARRKELPKRDCVIPFNALVYFDAEADLDYLRLWVPEEASGLHDANAPHLPIWLVGHMNAEMKLMPFPKAEDFNAHEEKMTAKIEAFVIEVNEEKRQ